MANRSQKSSTRLDRGVNKFYVIDNVRLTATCVGRTIAEACQSALGYLNLLLVPLLIENPDAEKSETKSVPADAADAAAS